ncbi:MAG: ubiquinone-binding protein, partial [Francisella sp.]
MKVEQSIEVPHQAQQMYGLVADIKAYPEFLPWCSGSAILYEQDNEIEARVDLNYLMIRQHFITHNHYVENKSIEVRLVEGPFTYLEGKWQFTATSEDSCLIHFELHYEFSNFLI